jgi:hypothetical protein
MMAFETKSILLIPAPVLDNDSMTSGSKAALALFRFDSWDDISPAWSTEPGDLSAKDLGSSDTESLRTDEVEVYKLGYPRGIVI